MSRSKRQIVMTGDHLVYNMLLFAFPLMISNLFQRLFNAADSVIIGRFSGANGLAAVGGVSSVVSLFTWGLLGLSIGADVVVSRMIGMKDEEGVHKAVHTAYFIALVSGAGTAALGLLLSRPILVAMGVPEEILPLSLIYIRIYLVGLLFTVVYNFGAACLRSSGDSTRPTLYLALSGLLNVLLNLLFVCVMKWDVAGVAIATALSQVVAASLVTSTLMREKGLIHLDLRRVRADGALAKQMVSIGLPSLLQNMLFSISNIVVQSSINAYGSVTMAANSAATTLEDFVYVSTSAVNQTCVTFTGQNNGAGNLKNIRKVMLMSVLLTSAFGFATGTLAFIFNRPLMGLFVTDAEVMALGVFRLRIVGMWLFLNGVVDVLAASMRGMGTSVTPMVTSLAGICGFRLIYIFTIYQAFKSLGALYLCYPLSWIITAVILAVQWVGVFRRFRQKLEVRV